MNRSELLTRILKLDEECMHWSGRGRHPIRTVFFQILTVTASALAWGIAVAVLWLCMHFHWFVEETITIRRLLWATIAPGFTWLVVKAMKMYWKRPRPFQAILEYPALSFAPIDDSFPSGHSASVVSFFVAIIMGPFSGTFILCAGVWMVLIMMSRFFLGLHYPTDILAGALTGLVTGLIFTTLVSAYVFL